MCFDMAAEVSRSVQILIKSSVSLPKFRWVAWGGKDVREWETDMMRDTSRSWAYLWCFSLSCEKHGVILHNYMLSLLAESDEMLFSGVKWSSLLLPTDSLLTYHLTRWTLFIYLVEIPPKPVVELDFLSHFQKSWPFALMTLQNFVTKIEGILISIMGRWRGSLEYIYEGCEHHREEERSPRTIKRKEGSYKNEQKDCCCCFLPIASNSCGV